jgi:hypothetical protein
MGKPRAKRLVVRLSACAVIGAVATIGVAWSALSFAPVRTRDAKMGPGKGWQMAVPEDWPPAPGFDLLESGRGWSTSTKVEEHPPREFLLVRARAGLPLPALTGTRLQGPFARPRWPPVVGDAEAPLPMRPLWTGFAIDTSLYGVIAFAVWSAAGLVRGSRRRARSHCTACGYDLKGVKLDECPECGRDRALAP